MDMRFLLDEETVKNLFALYTRARNFEFTHPGKLTVGQKKELRHLWDLFSDEATNLISDGRRELKKMVGEFL